ncbi:sirohydrochlorin ferrochelatase [Microbacterium trichothecenolyticum]|uniref:hypothetical protein n=1 Tax=Microbacterium trichothecenolyticum TaxID=69370 RepID=UPI0028653B78|nr:hypothetical protein [Microbacterium trichothecenolyticum]MDR7113909.1 sirohydrochlorin ferrochelatase [Microbacterium trichothecenolyticum]
MSIITEAFADYRECRDEYTRVLHAQYERAAEACRDALLNERGRRAGIEPITLFMGNRTRAYAYASEELVEYWRERPRLTFAMFERQWQSARDEQWAEAS